MRILAALLAVLLWWPGSTRGAPTPSRPNVVLILADDLGWTDLGCQGSRFYATPNIDRLASQGLKLNRYYHAPNCQPTRAALLTGQHGPRTGVYTVGSIDRFDWWKRSLRPVDNVTRLPLGKTTFAQALQQAGYATGLFGKWHLGEEEQYHPARRGFDEAIVSMGRHFDFRTHPKTEYPQGQYLADFLTDRAVDFIRRHKERPFLLYLPHFGVHSPHEAKPELIARFRDKPAAGGHRNATYAAMIASVDESVGRVLRTLDELKLADQTVVIFTSDNGGVGGYVREGLKRAGDVTDNAPLRSGKGSLYEGGIRVPFIVRWPGVTRPGSTSDAPAQHVDLFPTLLELARATAPGQPLDGESLVPLFRDSSAKLRRDAIFQHFPGYLGAGANTWRTTPVGVVHSGDWKLMEFYEDGRLELYQLRQDVGETNNLAASQPDRAKELQSRLATWRRSVGAKMPTPHQAGKQPSSTAQTPSQPPVHAVRRTDPNSMRAHEQLLAKARQGRIDVYFAGDSITRRWGCSDRQYQHLYANWRSNFFGWNAANFGWGGDKVQNILWRLEHGELEGVHPKVIVLLAGTNNLDTNSAGAGADSKVAEITGGLRAILDSMQRQAPRATIVLMGLLPRAPLPSGPGLAQTIRRINERLAGFADGKRIRYLDLTDRLTNAHGELLAGVTVDGLHLSEEGYQIWADALKSIFTELLGPAATEDHAPPPTGDPSAP